MRVAYDISMLGRGQQQAGKRAGIHRVVETLAQGLAASDECELGFCATATAEDLFDSQEYLRSHPEFAGVPLYVPRLLPKLLRAERALDNRLAALNKQIGGAPAPLADPAQLWKRVERRGVNYAGKLIRWKADLVPVRRLRRADVLHSPALPLPEAVRGPKRFVTVYDLVPLLHPQHCIPSQVDFVSSVLRGLLPDDFVFCISQATKDDLCDYAGFDPARAFVTHLAADPELFRPCRDPERIDLVRRQYGIPDGPYLLALSTLEPRKNIERVVRCFARLVREGRVKDLRLVLAGSKGWRYEKIFDEIAGLENVRDHIILTGYIANEDLSPLYNGALAFVYLSYYEGFGLPPLEAMQCGVPVVTSNTSSLPEVVGDAGLMFDPTDEDGVCQALLDLSGDPALRAEMSAKSLERAALFSWGRCVNETIAAYKLALGR